VGEAVVAIVMSAINSDTFSNARGYALLEEGEFEQALEQFEEVAADEPDEANAWDSLGEGYLANGRAEEALGAFTRALTIDSTFRPSIIGRGLSLAALGRYDDALARPAPDASVQAFLLSRVGRYREAAELLDRARREAAADPDAEQTASLLLTSSWLLIERRDYTRALEDVQAAVAALEMPEGDASHPLRTLADLLGGIAEIRAGNVNRAAARLASRKAAYDSSDRAEASWVAALEGEVALALAEHNRAMTSFQAAQAPVWMTLGGDTPAVFVTSPPSRDGTARVELARGDPDAAIDAYRRLTTVGPDTRSSGVLEPRHVLALARLLEQRGDAPGARAAYERFLTLWASADDALPELQEARRAVARGQAS
jgi:tetratricopeptide (TPR) repeat protein